MPIQAKRRFCQGVLALGAAAVLFSANGAAAATNPAPARTYDLCARIEDKDEAAPRLQTLHVKLAWSGPDFADDVRKLAQASLIGKVLAPQIGAATVYLEDYDPEGCAASGDKVAEIALSLTPEQVSRISEELKVRGGGVLDLPGLADIKGKLGINSATAASEQANQLWLKLFYATNRPVAAGKPTKEAFGNTAGTLSHGSVQVGVKRQPTMRNLESPAIVKFEKVSALEDFAVAGTFKELSLEQWRKEVATRAASHNKAGVLLLVHGYNNNFVEAAAIAGQVSYDLGFPGATVFFSWPSQGGTAKYEVDGEMAAQSVPAMAALLKLLAGLQAEGPVYVVAHSMGNRVLLGGLAQMLDKAGAGESRAFRQVVMAAPDVPQEGFKQRWGETLVDNGIKLTLYASSQDRAIALSEQWNGGKRLGNGGKDLFAMRHMDSIDASGVGQDLVSMRHAYFRDSNTVMGDLFELVRYNREAGKRAKLKRIEDAPSSWMLLMGK